MLVVANHYWAFGSGYVGVGFFFVLSGFVLALNYRGGVSTKEERRDFWFKRFARIYPTHLLTFLICLPLGFPWHAVPSLFLIQSWIPNSGIFFGGNVPSWSISNEAFFYALFPLLLGLRWNALVPWGAGLFVVAVLWPAGWPNHWLFYVFPPARLFEFTLGMALAKLRGSPNGWHEAGALALAAVSLWALPMFKLSFAWAAAFIPASAALVYVFARSNGPIARLLSNRWLVLLGDASFMLYMIHWPLMMYFGKAWWVSALVVVMSVPLFLWFEKPAQQKLMDLWNSRREKVGCGTIVA